MLGITTISVIKTLICSFSAVRVMKDAGEKFTSLQELLKSAIFHRQQLKYEQTRRYAVSAG